MKRKHTFVRWSNKCSPRIRFLFIVAFGSCLNVILNVHSLAVCDGIDHKIIYICIYDLHVISLSTKLCANEMAIDAHTVKSVRNIFNHVKHFAFEAEKNKMNYYFLSIFESIIWQYQRLFDIFGRIETEEKTVSTKLMTTSMTTNTIIANRRKKMMKMIKNTNLRYKENSYLKSTTYILYSASGRAAQSVLIEEFAKCKI